MGYSNYNEEDVATIDIYANESDDDDVYVLTEWSCMVAAFSDFGIDLDHISFVMGDAIVNRFMDLMVKSGHIVVNENANEDA